MIEPKKIQLVARMAHSNGNALDLRKPQLIFSRVNPFEMESSHSIYNNHVSLMDVDEGSDYESVVSSTDGTVRKRKRLNNLSHEEKIMRRKLKNREAAQSARDRKKQKMIDLERTINSLENMNKELAMENATLKNCTEVLLDENKRLKSQLNLSPSETNIKFEKKPQIIHIKKKKILPTTQIITTTNNTLQQDATTTQISNVVVASEDLNNYVQCFPTPSEVSECYDVITSNVMQESLDDFLDTSASNPSSLIVNGSTDSGVENYNTKGITNNKITSSNTTTPSLDVDNKNKLSDNNLSNEEAPLVPASRTSVKSAALGPLQQELSCLLALRLTSLASLVARNYILLAFWIFVVVSLSKKSVPPTTLKQSKMDKEVVLRVRKTPHRSFTRLRQWEKRPSSLRRWWGRHQKNWNPTANS